MPVESIDGRGLISASTSDELLDEIRLKHGMAGLAPVVAIGGVLLMIVGGAAIPGSLPVGGLIMAIALAMLCSTPWVDWHDRRRLTTYVSYEFDEMGRNVHQGIRYVAEALKTCQRVWSIQAEDMHGDWKRNAGAGTSVARQGVGIGWGPPPRVETNVDVISLHVGRVKLYLFPDRILVFGGARPFAVNYTRLTCRAGRVRFVEEGSVPGDATVVDWTWRYVRKDGGPDLRFNDNRKLPVAHYGVLDLEDGSGFALRLHTSKSEVADATAALIDLVREAVQDLQRRDVSMLRGPEKASFPAGPRPPLADQAKLAAELGVGAIKFGADAISYRWLSTFPDWLVSVVWGLIFAMPAVASLVLAFRGTDRTSILGTVGSLAASGSLVVALVRDGRRRDSEQAHLKAFKHAVIERLRSQPAREIGYRDLAQEWGLPPSRAETVADDLYLRMAAQVVADGVVTPKERKRLDTLAVALTIDPDRADVLERQAGEVRYQEALAAAEADGIITQQESRELEALRRNLKLEDGE